MASPSDVNCNDPFYLVNGDHPGMALIACNKLGFADGTHQLLITRNG